MSKTVLDVKDLSVYYGPLNVVRNLSFSINEGEIVALIGANGAGKSSIINGICGVLEKVTGEVTFMGERIDTYKPNLRVEKGLVQVPEGRLLFTSLTVLENLSIGACLPRARSVRERNLSFVYQIFPRLAERKQQYAGTLSGGEQQMLAIGRALMADPKVLILDEPSWGLAPKLVSDVFDAVKKINNEGVTILLVEQHIKQCLRVARRALVIENGKISVEGNSIDLLQNDHVKKAYLGM